MHRPPPAAVAATRRALLALLFALWWGGFTFYAAVVVPVGTKVLGGTVAQGFVTQPVTDRLNVLGAIVALALAWHLRGAWPRASTGLRRALAASWGAFALAQVALFALHPRLDALLDPQTRAIVGERATFYAAHRVYLLVAAAQWLAASLHALAVARAWAHGCR
jgi:hypothetical protein